MLKLDVIVDQFFKKELLIYLRNFNKKNYQNLKKLMNWQI